MNRYIAIALSIVVSTLSLEAQIPATLTGTVSDARTGEPLIGANVLIEGTLQGSTTDTNGIFAITHLTPGSYRAIVSFIGYERKEKTVTVRAGEPVRIDFALRPKLLDIPIIEIIGERIEQIQRIPGSALVIPETRLAQLNPTNANEVFRSVPGINVRDEEGQGLRPNIGIRGLDPTRSRKVLMLEDGVPIALAPYGEPELYYNPPIDRMKRVEILKGSGSILFGPQTVGGVINYITRQPPRIPTFSARLQAGGNNYLSGLFSYGGTWQDIGIETMYLRKQGDGFRDHSTFGIHDFSTQFALGLSPVSRLGIKVNVYDETSQSSYLGLTRPMFEQNPYQNPALYDKMDVRRYSVSASHQHIIGHDMLVTTTLYANNTSRNWRRQDYDRDDRGREYERIIGDTEIPGGALYMRNSTGNRNREFTVYGLEPRLQISHSLFSIANELDLGTRIHFEDMHILRIDGSTPTALSGSIREDELRKTHAVSGFAQNRFIVNNYLTATAGIRLEYFDFRRQFRRDAVEGELTDIDVRGRTNSVEVIPGFGITVQPAESITFFTGLHRGYSPPRVQDAIENTGRDAELDAEQSWNYELGFRTTPAGWLYGEMTAYYMNFQNQIIPASEAGGIDTRLINAGETTHQGLESTFGIDLGLLTGRGFNFIVEGSVTLSDASFASGIYSGNRLPHAPELMYGISFVFQSPAGINVRLDGMHTGEQYSDRANTRESSNDGEIGLLDAYTVWDLSVRYTLPWINASLFGTAKNIFDKVYIASRAPRGIFPGPFRQITVGMQWEL